MKILTGFHLVLVLTGYREIASVGKYTEYCSTPQSEGSCCQRFWLNVNHEAGVFITASSEYGPAHGSSKAALFGDTFGWAPKTNNGNNWIQVDFRSPRQVTGVLLQGRGIGSTPQWVTSFRVLFSNDGEIFYSTPIIEGTFDFHTVARRYFDRPIFARYVRLMPITYNSAPTIRFDLIGCGENSNY